MDKKGDFKVKVINHPTLIQVDYLTRMVKTYREYCDKTI